MRKKQSAKVLRNNSIYQGDCLEMMKLIPDKLIDMILCDLPYGTTACRWDTIIPFEPLWEQYKRIIKDNGAIILTASQPFTSILIMSNLKMFRYCWVWEKDKPTNFALANKQPMKYHEDIVVFFKKQSTYNKMMIERSEGGKSRYKTGVDFRGRKLQGTNQVYKSKTSKVFYNPNLKNPSSIIYFSTGRRQDLVHPTQKPVSLFEYLIKTYTCEGDLVLDNCSGSGTTGIACLNTKRDFILIEKEREYVEISKKRVATALRNSRV